MERPHFVHRSVTDGHWGRRHTSAVADAAAVICRVQVFT